MMSLVRRGLVILCVILLGAWLILRLPIRSRFLGTDEELIQFLYVALAMLFPVMLLGSFIYAIWPRPERKMLTMGMNLRPLDRLNTCSLIYVAGVGLLWIFTLPRGVILGACRGYTQWELTAGDETRGVRMRIYSGVFSQGGKLGFVAGTRRREHQPAAPLGRRWGISAVDDVLGPPSGYHTNARRPTFGMGHATYAEPFEHTIRYIAVPYWFAVLLGCIAPIIWARSVIRSQIRERRYAANLCPSCKYNLRATWARCPECGWTRADMLED